MRPTPGIPALTSRAGASLSFVFPTPPAAPRGLPELPVSVWCLAGADRESACSPVQVALQPPATSRPAHAPGAPSLSLDPVSTLELRSSVRCLVVHAPGSWTQSAVSRVRSAVRPLPGAGGPPATPRTLPELPFSVCCLMGFVRESAHSPVQVATASWHPNVAAPSPFHLSSNICARFHRSPLRTSILRAGDVHL